MDLSGIIFVALAVAWAVYLVPKALKHHDEVARTRSIDRFSTAMRVLARREPVDTRQARLVLTPARPSASTRAVVTPAASTRRARPVPSAAHRAAARLAARRRRRILLALLLATSVTAGVAAFAVVPWWAVAVPGGLVVVWLVVCRTQVRRLDRARGAVPGARPEVPATATVTGDLEISPDEDTITLDTSSIGAAVDGAVLDDASLWDPLPMTLPTYVTKPRAQRTVRTIDLSQPDVASSGHDAADSRLVEETAAAQAEEAARTAQAVDAAEHQRAVNG